ncbi:hypothetical protein J2S90_001701 [Arthrobacter bambusae]|uniref:CheW-like domain-containing protein n=1 Tax=Arthrobacter bambusae TaxID=1338426 RepID=A0AAW8DFS6_9MICC|nr:hypothetical protein [Arthrobacter bambusae]MDQ0129562.1 hypothetical protein [Arthrobacter bambusae]MDQ0180825.1 hypothetical protein [Arthrobacter bambusae]
MTMSEATNSRKPYCSSPGASCGGWPIWFSQLERKRSSERILRPVSLTNRCRAVVGVSADERVLLVAQPVLEVPFAGLIWTVAGTGVGLVIREYLFAIDTDTTELPDGLEGLHEETLAFPAIAVDRGDHVGVPCDQLSDSCSAWSVPAWLCCASPMVIRSMRTQKPRDTRGSGASAMCSCSCFGSTRGGFAASPGPPGASLIS